MTTAWRHARVVQEGDGGSYRVECAIWQSGPWEDSEQGTFTNPSDANTAALTCFDGATLFHSFVGGETPTVQYAEGFNGSA